MVSFIDCHIQKNNRFKKEILRTGRAQGETGYLSSSGSDVAYRG